MAGTRSTHGELRSEYNIFVGKRQGKSRRREDNIEMNLREVKLWGVDWIQVVQKRIQRRGFVNTVMNFSVP
jgi:hypothetical protein